MRVCHRDHTSTINRKMRLIPRAFMVMEMKDRSMVPTVARLLVKVDRCRDRMMIWSLVKRNSKVGCEAEGEEEDYTSEVEGEVEAEEAAIAVGEDGVAGMVVETVDRVGAMGEVGMKELPRECPVGQWGYNTSTGSLPHRSRLRLVPDKTAWEVKILFRNNHINHNNLSTLLNSSIGCINNNLHSTTNPISKLGLRLAPFPGPRRALHIPKHIGDQILHPRLVRHLLQAPGCI